MQVNNQMNFERVRSHMCIFQLLLKYSRFWMRFSHQNESERHNYTIRWFNLWRSSAFDRTFKFSLVHHSTLVDMNRKCFTFSSTHRPTTLRTFVVFSRRWWIYCFMTTEAHYLRCYFWSQHTWSFT